MDEAFLPFSAMIEKIATFEGSIFDEEKGIHSYIQRFEIDTPVELDVFKDEQGNIQIGIVPPLYRVETTFEPSYHSIRFSAEIDEQ